MAEITDFGHAARRTSPGYQYRRKQIMRQRREILELQRAGISTKSATELLERMLLEVDEMCAERTRLWAAERQINPDRRGTKRRGL